MLSETNHEKITRKALIINGYGCEGWNMVGGLYDPKHFKKV